MDLQQKTKDSAMSAPVSQQHGLSTVVTVGLRAGLAAGVIVLVPVLILQLARGVGIVPEMQLAASSLIGMAAYAGATGFVLGTLLHFFVSIVPAVAYALVVWQVPVVNRWAWISGLVLGIILFFFMGFVVLPLSAFTTPQSVTPMPFVPALLIHIFGLGLPISLITQRAWQPRRAA